MKPVIHHYRDYNGNIPCHSPFLISRSTRIDTTGVKEGVTCKRCLECIEVRERRQNEIERRRSLNDK